MRFAMCEWQWQKDLNGSSIELLQGDFILKVAGCICASVLSVCALISKMATANSVTYSYDDAGRLKTTKYVDGTTTTYGLDAAGNRSSIAVAKDTTPPSVPTGLAGTAVSQTQVNLTWSASTDNSGGSGLQGYKVYRGGAQVGISSTTSYSDTGLSASTTYTYAVSAYDFAGNTSALSSAINVTTMSPPTVTENATVTSERIKEGSSLTITGFDYATAGSISPTKLSNGTQSYYAFMDQSGLAVAGVLQISGFTADPGSAWLVSATGGSTTLLQTAVSSYSYSNGIGNWHWSSVFGFPVSGQVTVQLVHH